MNLRGMVGGGAPKGPAEMLVLGVLGMGLATGGDRHDDLCESLSFRMGRILVGDSVTHADD